MKNYAATYSKKRRSLALPMLAGVMAAGAIGGLVVAFWPEAEVEHDVVWSSQVETDEMLEGMWAIETSLFEVEEDSLSIDAQPIGTDAVEPNVAIETTPADVEGVTVNVGRELVDQQGTPVVQPSPAGATLDTIASATNQADQALLDFVGGGTSASGGGSDEEALDEEASEELLAQLDEDPNLPQETTDPTTEDEGDDSITDEVAIVDPEDEGDDGDNGDTTNPTPVPSPTAAFAGLALLATLMTRRSR